MVVDLSIHQRIDRSIDIQTLVMGSRSVNEQDSTLLLGGYVADDEV